MSVKLSVICRAEKAASLLSVFPVPGSQIRQRSSRNGPPVLISGRALSGTSILTGRETPLARLFPRVDFESQRLLRRFPDWNSLLEKVYHSLTPCQSVSDNHPIPPEVSISLFEDRAGRYRPGAIRFWKLEVS